MNFIEINNKKVWFFRKKGAYWIIVKSVCEALNVNTESQKQRIKDDPILGAATAVWQVQVPGDTQKRTYFCLPEEYIYGWIFSIFKHRKRGRFVCLPSEIRHLYAPRFGIKVCRMAESPVSCPLQQKQ
jgi:hypothetical protein